MAVRAIVRLQLCLGLVGFLILMLYGQMGYAFAYAYGVTLMAVNGMWLAGRLGKVQGLDVRAGQQSLYAGAAMRFVALIAGLLLAHMLSLHLLLVAIGMFMAQMGLFIYALFESRKMV